MCMAYSGSNNHFAILLTAIRYKEYHQDTGHFQKRPLGVSGKEGKRHYFCLSYPYKQNKHY